MTGDTSFAGTLTQYGGGQTLGGAYVAPTGSTSVGPVSASFTSPTAGTLVLTNGASIPIQRYRF